MAISKSIFLLLVLMWSSASVGRSQGGGSTQCVEKLLPCQAYLKGSAPAPVSCCAPLRQIVAEEAACLCALFSNPTLLKSLNVTQDDALNLSRSCGAHADASLCDKTAATPSAIPSTPASPSANSSTTSPPPPRKNAATAASMIGGLHTLAAIFFLIHIAF